MNIYIACGLTHVPREIFESHAAFVHGLAGRLSERGQTSVKYALVNSDPQLASKPPKDRARLCYLWDRKMVEEADLVVAECSFPSIGLGIELQIAESNDTPIVICFRLDARNKAMPVMYENPDHTSHELQIGEGFVTLMALGLPSVVKIIGYSADEDGFQQVLAAVSSMEKRDS